jgi:hypothetical protein
MNTLNEIVKTLKNNQLIETQQDFSGNWVEKNKNWLAYTKHKKRDFSIEAAISTLRNVRIQLAFFEAKQDKLGSIVVDTVDGLTQAEKLLNKYLQTKYGILDIK